ncbi:MAG: type II secretion system protein [Halieaceae bacterium]
MKTSVIFPVTPSKTPQAVPRHSGFTILELLVVLTLMAAMTGLALPQLARLYDSGQRAFERRELLDAIAALPYSAYQQQQGFTLTALPGQAQAVPLDLPAGWSMKAGAEQGIRYRSNGVCDGGRLQLTRDDQVEEFNLTPPLCSPFAP